MTIDWWTLALQAVNFLVLVWLLQRFLYKPVLAVIEKRKQLTDSAFAEAEVAKNAAVAEQRRLEDAQTELARTRQDLLKTVHADLDAERAALLQSAKAEAETIRSAARTEVAAERLVTLAEVKEQIADLAVEMAGALLQRVASAGLGDGFLGQLNVELDRLSEKERARLTQDLASPDARLQVVTAAQLTTDEQQRWRAALESRLGACERVEFAADASLIGGAELRFPHAHLSLSWSELLKQGKDSVLADESPR